MCIKKGWNIWFLLVKGSKFKIECFRIQLLDALKLRRFMFLCRISCLIYKNLYNLFYFIIIIIYKLSIILIKFNNFNFCIVLHIRHILFCVVFISIMYIYPVLNCQDVKFTESSNLIIISTSREKSLHV